MLRLVVSGVVGAALVLAWIGARNRHRFRYIPSPLAEAELARLATEGFRVDAFEVEPGVVLRGLVRRPAPGTTSWLLLFAGNGSGLLEGARGLGAKLAADTGWGVAVWAYRGFDGSGGTPGLADFAADGEKLWQRLQGTFGADPERVHLVSFSLGTALALRIAERATADGSPPASLVLLSPYDRIGVTQDVWWAPWSCADRYDALAYAKTSATPALVVYGTLDDAFPAGTSARLAHALGARAQVLELPGRKHAEWLGEESILRQIRAFIREHEP